MTLPSGTTIYMSQVNTELNRSATAFLDMNYYYCRLLAEVSTASGSAYWMSNFWGKSRIKREPTAGSYKDSNYSWYQYNQGNVNQSVWTYRIYWAGVLVYQAGYGALGIGSQPLNGATSRTIGTTTYFRDSSYDGFNGGRASIHRTYSIV